MSHFSLKKLCGVVGLALGIGIALFIAWPSAIPTTKPAIAMLGRTNDPANGPSMLFILTNQSDLEMSYLVSAPQTKTSGWWPPTSAPHGSGSYLPSHQATSFVVKIPTGADTFIVPVFYSYSPSSTERLRNELRNNINVNWIRLKRHEAPKWINNLSLDVYVVNSPEVTVPPETEPDRTPDSDR